MASDLSRKRFAPQKDFNGVVMQQGRVQLDADWNDQVEIVDRRFRAETVDILGRCAVPEETPDGFKIEHVAGNLTIERGRLYVDGLLAENHGKAPLAFDPVLEEERGTAPLPYTEQPYQPAPAALPAAPGTYLVYLEAWHREVTPLEDPELVEVAVGVDTTTRIQTAWQVKVHPESIGDGHCGTEVPSWLEAIRPSDGRLSSQAVDVPDAPNPCLIPPGAGYKGLENHLYRVEIHDGGPPDGTATFKWSRDNGIVASTVTGIPALGVVVVDSVGRDGVLRFNPGDWVEITDDHRELAGEPGVLRKIQNVDDATRTIELESNLPGGLFPVDAESQTDPERHTRIRRWDQQGEIQDTDGTTLVDLNTVSDQAIPVPPAGQSVVLENGVQVTFETAAPGEYRVGDSWVMAARTADASLEVLEQAPPCDIHRHYCRLALLHVTDAETWVTDCRPRHPKSCCTIHVAPGQDIQAAIDRIPAEGGKVCLQPGVHRRRKPLLISGRLNLTLEGCGPGSKLVLDPPADQAKTLGLIFVAGGSHNIAVRNLSAYTNATESLVVVDEASADVTVADAVLINAAGGDCLRLGSCAEISLQESTLVGGVGLLQAKGQELADIAAALAALRPAPNAADDAAAGRDVADDAVAFDRDGAPRPTTLRDLRVARNHFLSQRKAIFLGDVLGGEIAENIIHGVGEKLFAELQTEPEDLDRLHELFPNLVPPTEKPDLSEVPATGVEACLVEDLNLRSNRIWARAAVLSHYSRGLRATDNQFVAQLAGFQMGFCFDDVMHGNRIRIHAPAVIDEDPPRRRLTEWPAPTAYGIGLGFARGGRISDNDIHAPEGIVTHGKRGNCAEDHGLSLLRLLRLEKLWKVLAAFAWVIFQAVRLFWSRPIAERSREDFEAGMLKVFVGLLTNVWFPAHLGKLRITGNHLVAERYGILFEQILVFGGLRVNNNRVSGFQRAGIRIHPLLSVGRPEILGGWIRCLLETVIQFLQQLHTALGRFLAGESPDADNADDPSSPAAGILGAFLALCGRVCGGGDHGGDDGGDGGDGDDGDDDARNTEPIEDLRDALGDLIRSPGTWLDDLLNGSYDVRENALRGGGTGIWVGIDGTRVTDNRVTVEPDNPVPYETIVLGRLLRLEELRQREGNAPLELVPRPETLMDLDRGLLLLEMISTNEEPPILTPAITAWKDHVSESSPLQQPLAALENAIANGEGIPTAWFNLILTIWSHLGGYGIVLIGGDMECRDNQVDAMANCSLRTRAFDPDADGNDDGKDEPPPAVGGIWHFSNLGFFAEDTNRLVNSELNGVERLLPKLLMLGVVYLLLGNDRRRDLEVGGNKIRQALAHGIRAAGAEWLDDVDLRDNSVVDAARIGLRFLGDDDATVKVQRNTVLRTDDVFQFLEASRSPNFTADLPGFARLVEAVVEGGTALASQNHAKDRDLPSRIPGRNNDTGIAAFFVDSEVAAVMGNHVITASRLAFELTAREGLATDNLANTPSNFNGLQQGPDINNL